MAPAESRFFSGHEEKANAKSGGAQDFRGGGLSRDDALSIGDSAAVHEFPIFAEGMCGGTVSMWVENTRSGVSPA